MAIVDNLYIFILLFFKKGQRSSPNEASPTTTSDLVLPQFAAEPGTSSMNNSKYISIFLNISYISLSVIINGAGATVSLPQKSPEYFSKVHYE